MGVKATGKLERSRARTPSLFERVRAALRGNSASGATNPGTAADARTTRDPGRRSTISLAGEAAARGAQAGARRPNGLRGFFQRFVSSFRAPGRRPKSPGGRDLQAHTSERTAAIAGSPLADKGDVGKKGRGSKNPLFG